MTAEHPLESLKADRDPQRLSHIGRLPTHVFLGLTEVAGYYNGLAEGFDQLDIRCTFVDLSGNPHRYERKGRGPRWIQALEDLLARIRGVGVPSKPRRMTWAIARLVCKAPIGLWALAKCDLFIFGFRTHLAAHFELPLLKVLGKKSVFVFHGSDVRPPYLNGKYVGQQGAVKGRKLARKTRRIANSLRRIERWADSIVSHPPFAQLQQRAYAPWLWVGIPRPPLGVAELRSPTAVGGGPVRILHAPSLLEGKGTKTIREAVAEVRRRGLNVELIELFGRSNEEVVATLLQIDFVVDQVYSDTPMAGFATEAAAAGRVSVVSGYELDLLREMTPVDRRPPSIICEPEDLVDTISSVVPRPDLHDLGMKAKEFVDRMWAPSLVAERLLMAAGGTAPLLNPEENPFTHGWGVRSSRAKDAIRAVVRAAGTRGLRVGDRNTLEHLLRFADSSNGN